MKIQTGASDHAIDSNLQSISDWQSSLTRQISKFIKRYLDSYRLRQAQMHYRTVRELQQEADLAKGTIDALPIEEKLKLGIYRF